MYQEFVSIHKQGVFKLEGTQSLYILGLSLFCGGWATIIAGYLHKDTQVTNKAIALGLTQLLLQVLVVG